jgi:hypothetical protein
VSINTFDIQEGMEVFSSDGEKIGNVGEVFDNPRGVTESGAQATSTADEGNANTSDNTSGIAGVINRGVGEGGRGSGVDITRDPVDMQEEYGTTATATQSASDTGYFKVSEGGILGLGAKSLYIPFSAVETVAGDGVVTLSYTKDDVVNRFDHKPEGLENSDAADTPLV